MLYIQITNRVNRIFDSKNDIFHNNNNNMHSNKALVHDTPIKCPIMLHAPFGPGGAHRGQPRCMTRLCRPTLVWMNGKMAHPGPFSSQPALVANGHTPKPVVKVSDAMQKCCWNKSKFQ